MSENENTATRRKTWLGWIGFVVIILVAYFVYVEVQTRLGQQALDKTGLNLISLEDALNNAKATNKKVLVDISAIWCPTCRRLDKEIFGNNEVKTAIETNYVYTRLEYESKEAGAFMKKYAVKGFPTLVILDADGNKIKKLDLTFDPASFIAQL